jgi:hypothetical protein
MVSFTSPIFHFPPSILGSATVAPWDFVDGFGNTRFGLFPSGLLEKYLDYF